jgi:putative aldouronate transport system permease protein
MKKDMLKNTMKRISKCYQLYLLIIPALLYIIIYHYIPMYGVQIAFKDFRTSLGIAKSPWVGFVHFIRFLNYSESWRIIRNTLGISLYSLAVCFPAPIILAIMVNEVRSKFFKKTVQMITYIPHFISTVVICGMIILFLNSDYGIINNFIVLFGGERRSFIIEPQWFKTIYVISDMWQQTGWASIIYIAVLSNVDMELVEATKIDGANRLQKIWHLDISSIAPTIVLLLILRMGTLLSVGFEKVFLLQNPLNMTESDIISTYIYRIGLIGGQYSYTSAIGLLNNVINFIILVTVNYLARRISDYSVF